MDLTQQQISALQHGDIVPLTVHETECVVVRKDVFDQMQTPVYDDGDWTAEETSATGVAHVHDDG